MRKGCFEVPREPGLVIELDEVQELPIHRRPRSDPVGVQLDRLIKRFHG